MHNHSNHEDAFDDTMVAAGFSVLVIKQGLMLSEEDGERTKEGNGEVEEQDKGTSEEEKNKGKPEMGNNK